VFTEGLESPDAGGAHVPAPLSGDAPAAGRAVAKATGRELPEWFKALEAGPSLLRFDERVNWLRDEHSLSHGYATAIVHEHDRVRAHRSFD
jgi:hypothetical protein